FWNSIPNFQHFGECPTCNNTWESMEQILTECQEPGQKEIWDLASEMWRMKTGRELRPTIGQIMAAGATKVGNAGENRLYKILVTESMHLIWRIRNERRIQGTGVAPLAIIKNRWLHSINNRLALDCAITDKFKWEKKSLKISLVKSTWKNTLKDEHTLAKEWPRTVGAL
ncbi:hypothetical protein C8R45DRAFT_766332, partial [Mycena sanguinolenta]